MTTTIPDLKITNLAVAILVDKFISLSKEEKDDVCTLMNELANTQSPDEITEIFQSIEEILSQRKITLTKMDFDADSSGGNWKAFVSKTIREQRRVAGITQAELAEKSGLLQSHISRLENGQYSATRMTLVKIAKSLGIPLSKLDPSVGTTSG